MAELPHFDRVDDLGDNRFMFVHVRAPSNNFEVQFIPEAEQVGDKWITMPEGRLSRNYLKDIQD